MTNQVIELTINGQVCGFSADYLRSLVETPKVETPKVETQEYTLVDWFNDQLGSVETPKVETPKVETPKATRQSATRTIHCDSMASLIKAVRERANINGSFDPAIAPKAKDWKPFHSAVYMSSVFGSGLDGRYLHGGLRGRDGYHNYYPTKQGKQAGLTKIRINKRSGQFTVRTIK